MDPKTITAELRPRLYAVCQPAVEALGYKLLDAQVYLSAYDGFWGATDFWRLGFKIRIVDASPGEHPVESIGTMFVVSALLPTILERALFAAKEQLLAHIAQLVFLNKPLPIRALTVEDKKELEMLI